MARIYFASINDRRNHHGTILSIANGRNHFPQLVHNDTRLFAPPRPLYMTHKERMAGVQVRYERYAQRVPQQLSPEDLEAWYQRLTAKVDDAYIGEYLQLLALQKDAIHSWQASLAPRDTYTLCCFCPEVWHHGGTIRSKFCHRQLAAEYLKQHTAHACFVH